MVTIANTCLSSVNGFLTAPYTAWFPVVVAVALAVLAVLSFLYILSPALGRNDIRTWVRFKIVDVFLSIIFILIFAAFASATCTVNPSGFFQQYGMLPKFCQSAQTINNVAVPVPNNLYSIALCDIYTFNSNSYAYLDNWFFGGMIAFAFLPSLSGSVPPIFGGFIGITFRVGLPVPVLGTLGVLLGGIYLLQVVNEMQLILISTAPLLFAIFMSIGLIARIFGITRTFGGAMIAFGIGIGLVYPFIVAITYGFIGVLLTSIQANVVASGATIWTAVIAVVQYLFANPIVGAGYAAATPNLISALVAAFQSNIFYQIVEGVGLIFVGMSFIPFINFLILDAFIVDFSAAVGERMNFMSLLTRLV